jgi:TRAP-type C4-dicarboxylate transport system permease small subunit
MWIARIETVVLIIVLAIMVLLAFLQVVLRNFFDYGLLWGDIFLRHLVLWVGFIGASLATRDEKHINIDLFTRFLPDRWKGLPKLLTYLFSVVVCWFLTDAAYTFVIDERLNGTVAFNDVPAWYLQIIIPIGFFIMMLRFLVLAIENLLVLLKPNQDES